MKLGLMSFCLFSLSAHALEFNEVTVAQSSVAFGYKQMGVPLTGSFAKFAITANFDPAKPQTAAAKIDISLASIDTGDDDANDEVKNKDWFNTTQFPNAQFIASRITPLGGNRFEARGKLTLKGKVLDVVAPFTFNQTGAKGIFDGALQINRLDYAIGTGLWADVSTVADKVTITFHFVASSKQP
jgi:polyisoprenoid-binding protein YceI